jgi:hypothetical protein
MSIPVLSTIVAPLVLQVEFRDRHWAISKVGAWAWLVAAVASDLLVQFLFGNLTWLTGLVSLVTLSFGMFPSRWVHMAAGLYTGQALVSAVLAFGLTRAGAPHLAISIACYLWAAWCFFAQVLLSLRYLRTPKSSFAI